MGQNDCVRYLNGWHKRGWCMLPNLVYPRSIFWRWWFDHNWKSFPRKVLLSIWYEPSWAKLRLYLSRFWLESCYKPSRRIAIRSRFLSIWTLGIGTRLINANWRRRSICRSKIWTRKLKENSWWWRWINKWQWNRWWRRW